MSVLTSSAVTAETPRLAATPARRPFTRWSIPVVTPTGVDARDAQGATALIRAAEDGNVKAIRLLLEDGADINATDRLGWSALMKAVKGRHIKAVADLVAAGANIHAETRSGWNALSIAVKTGSPAIIALIANVSGKPKPD